ncbi:MAG: SDR family NAD(P)-dependent oxidoreductase, partial [Desulfobacteraceae bacterium]|nr:SDR family NAD(P)-dependent oxidoreductase [Desulfobacteraceae bacterium]
MTLSQEARDLLQAQTGMVPIPTDEGIHAWRRIASQRGFSHCVVFHGESRRIRAFFNHRDEASQHGPDPLPSVDTDRLYEKTEILLKELLADILKLPVDKIDNRINLERYGIDSLTVNRFNLKMEELLGPLPKTLLFENQRLKDLTEYLVAHYAKELAGALDLKPAETAVSIRSPLNPKAAHQRTPSDLQKPTRTESRVPGSEDIAVIGMSGRYPMADSIEVFWENLKQGKDCITEIPRDRWDYRKWYHPDPLQSEAGRMYCKWGGFIEDADKFDPLFFHISPREAEIMDPQERLFLETAWAAVEDAGYSRSRVEGRRVGVYVGVTSNTYLLWGPEARRAGNAGIPQSLPWSIANRVSYLFNFKGPSLPVDTACSASLYAVHLACESLRRGECEMALAGGVNLYLHPSKYVQMCQSGMLSPTGRCRSFGAGGDGFVPGEGVGAVLLKPLDSARQQGDPIYGVIKATAVNHGGRSTGYTVPNPMAQAELIETALEKSGLEPETITYIEAHGTGTTLGDPVEVRGLTQAFGTPAQAGMRCALGSVKSNIGHLESAAGIAALTKVLLQMKHGHLVPSLHADSPNDHIDFENSGFTLQRSYSPWKRPVVARDGAEITLPRRAGISSFGAGGANAHVIVEEAPAPDSGPPSPQSEAERQLIVLSARTEDRLREYADRLLRFLDSDENPDRPGPDLPSIAYTLQTGREAMAFRLAVATDTLDELKRSLRSFVGGKRSIPGLYHRGSESASPATALLLDGREGEEFFRIAVEERKLGKLAQLWVSGVDMDWTRLHRRDAARSISLPTYPFERNRYWITVAEETEGTERDAPNDPGPSEEPKCLYWQPVWIDTTTAAPPQVPQPNDGPLLLLDRDGSRVETFRRKRETDVVLVTPGAAFRETREGGYSIRPGHGDDYRILWESLSARGALPRNIVHFWSRDLFPDDGVSMEAFSAFGIQSLFHLSKSLIAQNRDDPTQLLYIYPEPADRPQPQYAAVSGFARTLVKEHPDIRCKTIGVSDGRDAAAVACAEMDRTDGTEIRYDGMHRRVMGLAEPTPVSGSLPFSWVREKGVYLITGGAGGLGRRVAGFVADVPNVDIVLAGRSVLTPEKRDAIESLHTGNARITYLQADLADEADTRALLDRIRTDHGDLAGIFHCAGVINDSYILRKTLSEMEAVLGAKVDGTLHLDRWTRNVPLDFFILFSAAAGVLGNVGQCDYAYANRFMDAFARLRELWREAGKRHGRTLSIAWPLWKSGGMRMPADTQRAMTARTGLYPLPTSIGLAALKDAFLRHSGPNGLVAYGAANAIRAYLKREMEADGTNAPATGPDHSSALRGPTERFLRDALAHLLKLDPGTIDVQAPLEEYGLDSILINRFNLKMEELLGPLPKTLLFEYPNLRQLAAHMARRYGSRLTALLGGGGTGVADSPAKEDGREIKPPPLETGALSQQERATLDGIAVIGIAGRYPMAESVASFWRNLMEGKDCITEIPRERWDYRPFFDPDPDKSVEGKIYCKWGGFLTDADRFDPLFFHIPPGDAELIDPQERLFLETSWEVLEDAGYTRSMLREKSVGVFVGVTTNTYPLWGPDLWRSGNRHIPASYPWSIANRVSYCFDFSGPSIPVDTACSASLTAVHMACESIRGGACDMAVAGGVNLYLHPAKYIQLCQLGMLSPTGRCRTFDRDADGFVPGEGVGAVLLKPLSKAVRDGDPVYGLIRASGVNHGGKTNGYTVPNPRGQAALIARVMQQGGIDPGTISYVEAHGTGTSLGDPVEIRGLSKAFAPAIPGRRCAIGSVKTNIGHLEAAAGIAGITKILLQMAHRRLAPSLHCRVENPKIDFGDSPFYVQKTASDWDAEVPRRAAISSFGAGGANAHLILEEFVEDTHKAAGHRTAGGTRKAVDAPPAAPEKGVQTEPQVIVLSARNEDRLRVYAGRMAEFLENSAPRIENIAFTLQTGREAMRERMALVVSDSLELFEKLKAFASGETGIDSLYRGNAKKVRNGADAEQDMESPVSTDPDAIARAWVIGTDIEWARLHEAGERRRLPLPTYPFERTRYWLPDTAIPPSLVGPDDRVDRLLHPLLHRNTSTLTEQRFQTLLSGREFFLSDHVVNGEKTLPGAAYLEMARAAGEIAGERPVAKLSNIVWTRPIRVSTESVEVGIALVPGRERHDFEVYTLDGEEKQIHVQGKWTFADTAEAAPEPMDVSAVRDRCPEKRKGDTCYRLFHESGLRYGPAFQSIEELFIGKGEVLASLRLPESEAEDAERFFLHPSILDGAFQTVSGLVQRQDAQGPHLPYALKEIAWFAAAGSRCLVYGKRSDRTPHGGIHRFDIRILDEAGRVRVWMKDFCIKAGEGGAKKRPTVSIPENRPPEGGDAAARIAADSRPAIRTRLEDDLVAMVSELLKTDQDQIDLREEISEYGFDSIRFTALANIINDTYGLEIMPT